MSSLEVKREQFRSYLERSGVIDNLSNALIKLYEEPNKPDDAVRFVRKYMCESCPDEEQYDSVRADLHAANATIEKLEKELEKIKSKLKRSSSEMKLIIQEGFEKLQANDQCRSLLRKYLTTSLIDELIEQKTSSFSSTILDCIDIGLKDCNHKIGIRAADPECYTVFGKLFDPIIKDYHYGIIDDGEVIIQHPPSNWNDTAKTFKNFDANYVLSMRMTCARNLEEYPFYPTMKTKDFESIQKITQAALECLEGEHKGDFYNLESLDASTQEELLKQEIIFTNRQEADKPEKVWPTGRSVFYNPAKNFIVWINEQDHIKIISHEISGDFNACYNRLWNGSKELEKTLRFIRDDRLGYLTLHPENLGNGFTISVFLKIPKISSNMEELMEIVNKYNLDLINPREEPGPSSVAPFEDGIFNICSMEQFGIAEWEIAQKFCDGLQEIIELEKNL